MCESDRGPFDAVEPRPADPVAARSLKRLLNMVSRLRQDEARAGIWPAEVPAVEDGRHAWRDWLAHERASLSEDAYATASRLLDQLAAAELAVFRKSAQGAEPANQVICASTLGASITGPDAGLDEAGLSGHEPALVRVPRVFGHALALRDEPYRIVLEEGLVRLHARGSAAWYAAFMAHRAVARGWGALWVAGTPGFRRQMIDEARRLGIEAASYVTDLGEGPEKA